MFTEEEYPDGMEAYTYAVAQEASSLQAATQTQGGSNVLNAEDGATSQSGPAHPLHTVNV